MGFGGGGEAEENLREHARGHSAFPCGERARAPIVVGSELRAHVHDALVEQTQRKLDECRRALGGRRRRRRRREAFGLQAVGERRQHVVVDGDAVLADTAADGGFLPTCHKFEKYVRERFATAK